MKVKKLSALRSKRALHRMNGAEPQVVGLTPQTTDIRKTDAMTPYILRQPKPVEPEKSGGDASPHRWKRTIPPGKYHPADKNTSPLQTISSSTVK